MERGQVRELPEAVERLMRSRRCLLSGSAFFISAELPAPAWHRPVLLLSRDEAYEVRALVTVVPITTRPEHSGRGTPESSRRHPTGERRQPRYAKHSSIRMSLRNG